MENILINSGDNLLTIKPILYTFILFRDYIMSLYSQGRVILQHGNNLKVSWNYQEIIRDLLYFYKFSIQFHSIHIPNHRHRYIERISESRDSYKLDETSLQLEYSSNLDNLNILSLGIEIVSS